MEKTKRKVRLCAVLIALNLVIIWGNSLLPGSVSGAISGWVRDLLAALFPGGSSDPDAGHGLLRKLAHFTEFAALGGLLLWLFAMHRKTGLPAFFCGALAAGVDETIQCFVPERGPSILDVLLDSFGVATGIFLVWFAHTILKKRKQALEDNQT